MRGKYIQIARVLVCLMILTNVFTPNTVLALSEAGQMLDRVLNSWEKKNTVAEQVYGTDENSQLPLDILQETVTDAVYNPKNQIIVKYKSPSGGHLKMTNAFYPVDSDRMTLTINHKQIKEKKDKIKTKIKSELHLKKLETKYQSELLNMDVLETDGGDLYKLAECLKNSPDVEYVQPNYPLSILSTPTEPLFPQQWGLYNLGQETGGEAGRKGVDINIQSAWGLTKGSQEVIVGILDTGIDINHEDLRNNIYRNTGEIPGNGIDDDGNGYIDDVNGWDFFNGDNTVYDGAAYDMHGTAVAGIIAAAANGKGTIGVAPNIKIMPLKFIHGTTGYTCDAIKAIEYAMKKGVKIINCSFGGSDNNYALKDAMKNSGILFIAAAGNRGGNTMTHPTYPACFDLPNVIGVASINNKGVKSRFSGYGPYIDIAAPGEQIMTTMPNNKYDFFTGTSASTPHVTGVAALLKSYAPNLSYKEITDRILGNAVTCSTLQGKVTSNGRVDAYGALTNTKPQPDTYIHPGEDLENPGDNEFNNDSWYTMDQLSKIKEQIHYGESGVNPTTGNYSFTVNDMTMDAPGFQINISRTYNSKNFESSLLGKGWTFGFEGSLFGENNIRADLPNGSIQMFKKQLDGSYRAEDSRSSFVKNADGTYLLTTKDQYAYYFNKDRRLIKMVDPKGNEVNITIDGSGKISKITDQVGRTYSILYNSNGLISEISDPMGRKAAYKYQNNLLTEATDPMGMKMHYTYDSHGYIAEVKNHNQTVIQKLIYNHTTGYDQGKVIQSVDAYGSMNKYTYDTVNKKTTIIENNSDRTWAYWYDESNYIIRQQDPEGGEREIRYYLTFGENKFGDIEYEIDEYGNKISYEIDHKGNVTRIVYPDNSTKTMMYDEKNNLIKENDQEGKVTYYIYDENKIYLQKVLRSFVGSDSALEAVIRPQYTVAGYVYGEAEAVLSLEQMFPGIREGFLKELNEEASFSVEEEGRERLFEPLHAEDLTDSQETAVANKVYGDPGAVLESLGVTSASVDSIIDPKNYAITTYTYYTDGEAKAMGLNAKGMLKSETEPEGNSVIYTYDSYGNIKTVKDGEGNITVFSNNILGWKLEQKTPRGFTTKYEYDKNGQLIKTVEQEGETKRIVYDLLGRKVKEILPNQYNAAEEKENYSYGGNYGRRYVYFDNGLLKTETDPMGNQTEYTYDVYGNIKTKTLPSGGIYVYTYDKLDRVSKVQFKETSGGEAKTLEEYAYLKAFNKQKQIRQTLYLNHKDRAVTTTTYDYRENPLLIEYPDGTSEGFEYFRNGKLKAKTLKNKSTIYYYYDPLDRLVREYTPLEEEKGGIRYTYKAYTYDKAGRTIGEKVGIEGVLLGNQSQKSIEKTYGYDKNGKVKEIQSNRGGKILYVYDKDGNVAQKEEYLDNQNKNVTTYTYNHRNQLKTETLQVQAGHIYGNAAGTTTKISLTTTYTYDKNGNLGEVLNAEGIKTSYAYDFNNNQTKITNYLTGAEGNAIAITKEVFYDTQGQPIKIIDPNKNITEYEYDKRGFLIRTKQPLGAVTLYQYDLAGRKIGEVTPKNYISGAAFGQMNRTELTYDLMGRLKTKEYFYKDQSNQWQRILSKTMQYNSMGQVEKESDALGYKNNYGTFMTYDLAGNLKTVLDPVAKDRNKSYSQRYEYDALGRKITEVDGRGVVLRYEYDDDGNIIRTKRQKNHTAEAVILEENTYDYLGNRLTQKDGNGNVTTYSYNAYGSVASIEYPYDSTIGSYKENYQYDRIWRLISVKDTMGKETINDYDALGRMIRKTSKGQNEKDTIVTGYTYDYNGNLTSETDGRGHKKTYVYDGLNRLKTESGTVAGILKTKQYAYDLNGNSTDTTDWLGNQYTKIYDPLDRLIEERDPYGKAIQKITYNDAHLQIKSVDALGNTTEYQYDKNNRLIYTIDPLGKTEGMSYDDAGNVVARTDKKNRTTAYTYDEGNQLTEVAAPDGSMTKYAYDPKGNLIAKTDGNGNTLTYEYNKRNLLVREILPEGRTGGKGSYIYQQDKIISFTYFGNGSLQTKTDPMGQRFDYSYDLHGRMIRERVNGLTQKEYTYDQNGNPLTMTNPKGTVTMAYDEENRLISKQMPGRGILRYAYDNKEGVGEVKTTVTDPKGNITIKIFDKAGRLKTVENKGEKTQYSYYDNGSRKEIIYPAGTKETYQYSKRGEVTKLTNKKADGTLVDEYTYTYDDNGNQLTKIEKKGTTSYTYDSVNRLKEVQEPGGIKTSFEYDKAGNRIAQIEVTAGVVKLTNYSYNNRNQLEKETLQDAGKTIEKTYRYDANGNLTSKAVHQIKALGEKELGSIALSIAGDGKTEDLTLYQYNPYNQLIKTVTGNQTITYGYNIEGYRDAKSIVKIGKTGTRTEETLLFTLEGNKVILEADGAGNVKAENTYGLNLIARKADNEKAYYLYNAHGDVTALSDGTGKILGTYQYDAFGNIREKTYQKANPYTYAGYRYDEELELYYLNARYYDPKIARFLTEDTYKGDLKDPLSLNLYAYCANNPIRYYDPTGHVFTEWDKKNVKNKKDRQAIKDASKAWENAKTDAERAAAHKKAEDVRNKYRNRNEKGRGDGYTVEKSTGKIVAERKETNAVGSKERIISSEKSTIVRSGFEDAETLVSAITKQKVFHYFWRGEYSIYEYSYEKAFKDSYNDVIHRAEYLKSIKDLTNLYMSIRMAEGSTGTPILDVGKGVVDHWKNPEPSISSTVHEEFLTNKDLVIAEKKLKFIINSPYKHLIYTKFAREKFIEELSKLEKDIARQDIIIYNNKQDNETYRQTMMDYVKGIREININFEQSKENVDYMVKQIKSNVSATLEELRRKQKIDRGEIVLD